MNGFFSQLRGIERNLCSFQLISVQLSLEEFDGDTIKLFRMFGLRVQSATGHRVEFGGRRHVKGDKGLLDRQNFIFLARDKQHGHRHLGQ